MARTNQELVIGLLRDKGDYGPLPDGSLPDLTGYIDSASMVVDQMSACAIRKGLTVTDAFLEIIERWVAAHLYGVSDRPYASTSNSGASATFQGQTGMGFQFTGYGQQALALDWTGCLDAIVNRKKARGVWLGKTRTDQLSYEDRN